MPRRSAPDAPAPPPAPRARGRSRRLPVVAPPGLPDVRDGLTRLDRIILQELARAARELGRARVPTALLYGRVVERIGVGTAEFQAALGRLAGRGR
jgi:hypothetical protein